MIGTIKRSRGAILVTLISGAAALLFVLAPTASRAVEAKESQELKATVNSQISWGSAGGCVQNIQTNDFGSLVPNATSSVLGSFDALPHTSSSTSGTAHVWVGCVTTNTTLASVAAQGTKDMASGSNTLPLSDVAIGLTNASSKQVNGGTAGCEITAGSSSAGACTLATGGSAQALVSGAKSGTTELNWQYQLNLPANQAVGTYTGGLVTFTATA